MENTSRNKNAELAEGMSDGLYRKVVTDRGGVVDPATYQARRDLSDIYFGIHETRVKTLPDGTIHATPGYVVTPPPRLI